MTLGFVSAILPDLSFEEVVSFVAGAGFDCVELMCWPQGEADRRYAGVTHVDVTHLDAASARAINGRLEEAGVTVSSLGYYPNPLTPHRDEAERSMAHLRHVLRAAELLGIRQVTTFVGRDWTKSVDANWPRFEQVWGPLVAEAEAMGVRVAIENCPMYYTEDEWPGGKNLASSPAIWRRMFEAIPSAYFGLNYDPSHLVWQHIDYVRPLRTFAGRLFHVHAKDVRVDRDRLDEVGILAHPLAYHTPKLPGLGDIDWGRFFSVLTDTGYDGPVCIEVEDRAYEGSLEARKRALRQGLAFLRLFIPGRVGQP